MNWLFQCNPKRYNLSAAIDHGRDDNWSMNQNRALVAPGDKVYFWETGEHASLRAVGTVTSPVYDRPDSTFGSHAVDVVYDARIEPPLTRQEIANIPVLSSFRPFSWAMGTNIAIHDEAVVRELDTVLRDRLIPIHGEQVTQAVTHSQRDLDSAIKQANRNVGMELRRHISDMDPIAFEWLVRALLIRLGYKNVQVTQQSNDGGVDVNATLSSGGIANIKTAIQVKRTKTVGRPVVQNLRGSLTAHQAGLLITSGSFADSAREEAEALGKTPIALLDGGRLVDLLLQTGLGARQSSVALYRLNLDDLDRDTLEAVVEQQGESDDGG